MENFLLGLGDVFNQTSLAFMLFGVVCGIVVGAVPGLSGPMAIALCIPLTYYMTPVGAVGFLVGINKGGTFGGSIASILLNTPGSPESAATCYDGYPLALQRKGEKALKISLFASFFGDTISAISLVLLSVPLASVALKLAPADICAIILFSLVLVSGLDTGSMSKGLIAGALGMLLGCIGLDPVSGQPRLDFGILQLSAGIPLMCLAIGTLAMSEILFQMQKSRLLEKSGAELARTASRAESRVSRAELKSVIRTAVRSSGIGVVIGVLPGLGATMAAFMAYGAAKKASRHPEEFGKGSLEGVAAPEAANNAIIGANLVPLLTLGIPGDTITAVLLGALMVQGLAPGPLLFSEHPEVIQGIYVALIICNIFMLIIGLLGTPLFAQIIKIPNSILMPCVLMLCFVGTYAIGNKIFDVRVALALGVIGFIFGEFEIPVPPALLGLILGQTVESNMRRALMLSNGDWLFFLQKPISAVFIALSVLSIAFTLIRDIRQGGKTPAAESENQEKE